MQHPEDALQIATAQYVQMALHPSVIAHHSENERQGARAGAKAKAKGQLAGFPDWVFMWHEGRRFGWAEGHTIVAFIELKSAKGVLSTSQKKFKALADAMDAEYAICRDLTEFVATIKAWGVPHRGE